MIPRVGAQHAAPSLKVDAGNGGRSMLRPYKNQIRAADVQDWQAFQFLSEEEGWRVPNNELSLHQQGGCSRAWALRDEDTTIGLITGLRHQHSAWIGNLIITPEQRGRGYGAALFDHTVQALRAGGATTLWLTASTAGAPLYAARGFHPVGQVQRWVRKDGGNGKKSLPSTTADGSAVDAGVWGDDRSRLLRHLQSNGTWLQQGASRALLQRGDDLQIIGPWYGSRQPQDDADLLARLVATAMPQVELVIDLISHAGREELPAAAGFTPSGSTALMVSGPTKVQWSRLLALATLGSCG